MALAFVTISAIDRHGVGALSSISMPFQEMPVSEIMPPFIEALSFDDLRSASTAR